MRIHLAPAIIASIFILGFVVGINAEAQRASSVADVRTFCKYLTEHRPAGQAGINGIDFNGAMTLLACLVDEIDQRLQVLEQKQRELGDPK